MLSAVSACNLCEKINKLREISGSGLAILEQASGKFLIRTTAKFHFNNLTFRFLFENKANGSFALKFGSRVKKKSFYRNAIAGMMTKIVIFFIIMALKEGEGRAVTKKNEGGKFSNE